MSTETTRTAEGAAGRIAARLVDGRIFGYSHASVETGDLQLLIEMARDRLAETDPAPISTQALRADGWEFINNREWKNGDSFVGQVAFIWFFRCLSNRVQINSLETMGQLRTAVRLSQPPSSSTKGEGVA